VVITIGKVRASRALNQPLIRIHDIEYISSILRGERSILDILSILRELAESWVGARFSFFRGGGILAPMEVCLHVKTDLSLGGEIAQNRRWRGTPLRIA
jgi:hypothetical protein